MAKKIKTPAAVATEEVSALLAEQRLQIGGRDIVVRGYTFYESLVLRPLSMPLIAALRDIDLGPNVAQLDAMLDILSSHRDITIELAAVAAGKPLTREHPAVDPALLEWVYSLSSAEGEALTFAWWVVNGDFFIRQVTRPLLAEIGAKRFAGAKSSPPSSPADTTPSDSSTTPARS